MDAHSTKPPAGIVITSMHADHLDDLADLERNQRAKNHTR